MSDANDDQNTVEDQGVNEPHPLAVQHEVVPTEEGRPNPEPAEGDVNDGGEYEVAPVQPGAPDPEPAEGGEVEVDPDPHA